MQLVAKICQNRTVGKDQFVRKSSVSQIEKCKTNGSFIIPWGMCTKIADQYDVLRIFTNFYSEAHKSVSGQQLPQILPPSY
jgi:hypothetical protein